MFIKKGQLPLLIVIGIALIYFSSVFIRLQNYEFLTYIGVIVFFLVVILQTNNRVDYPLPVLWGLVVWAIMHMSGGGLFFNGTKLYEIILIPLVGEPYSIFKYDQLVHIVGFGAATLLMYYLLKPSLAAKARWVSLSIVIVMAGLGVGALNEIIEFAVTVVVPETGVGGYENTSLDLVADLVGAVLALAYIRFRET
jgi:hypothetical protein